MNDAVVERCQAGDESAWVELFRRDRRRIRDLILHHTVHVTRYTDPAEVDEIEGDVWLSLVRSGVASWTGQCAWTTWLYAVVHYSARRWKERYYRKHPAYIELGDAEALTPDGEPVMAEVMGAFADPESGRPDRLYEARAILRRISEMDLPPRQRQAMAMSVQGWSGDEMARSIPGGRNRTRSAMAHLVSAARKKILEEVA